MDKTSHFQGRGTGLISGQGTKIPNAMQYSKKKKKKFLTKINVMGTTLKEQTNKTIKETRAQGAGRGGKQEAGSVNHPNPVGSRG